MISNPITCLTLSLFIKSEGGGAKHSPSDVTSRDLCDRASEASSTIKLMMPIQRYTPKHMIAMDKQLSSSLKKWTISKSDNSTNDVTAACRHVSSILEKVSQKSRLSFQMKKTIIRNIFLSMMMRFEWAKKYQMTKYVSGRSENIILRNQKLVLSQ